MELLTLDSNFQPAALIDNYASLIWSERYSSSGDFELKTYDVSNMLNALPLESCITLRESTVPMIVEVAKIEKPKGDAPLLTLTGRSYETVIERRAAVKELSTSVARATWLMAAAKESDAAYQAMRMVLGDIERFQGATPVLNPVTPAVSPYDAISSLDLTLPADFESAQSTRGAWTTSAAYLAGDKAVDAAENVWIALVDNTNVAQVEGATWHLVADQTSYEISAQNLYTTVMELVVTNFHGMKAVRPTASGTKVGIEIYNGADLTPAGPGPFSVVFDGRFDQVEDATYLFSQQGSTNVGYIYGTDGGMEVLKTAAAEPSDLARRVLILDDTEDSAANAPDILRTRGLVELYKYNSTALFDGQVSDQVGQLYNKPTSEGGYSLGDIVQLTGDYGLSETVRVAEFIRTSDNTGDKSYPTFEVIDDV